MGWGATDWIAVAGVAQVGVLLAAALYARRQVREARELRAAQMRPYVVVYFETSTVARNLIDLVVENIGLTPAQNVSIKFSPPLKSSIEDAPDQDRVNDWVALSEGIPYLAPRQRMTHLVENAITLKGSEMPRRYEVTVSYSDVSTSARRKVGHKETYVLDVGVWFGSEYIEVEGLHDISKSIAKVADTIKGWTEGFRGVRVFTTDQEKHDARQMEMMEKRRAAIQRMQDQTAEDPPPAN